MGYGYAGCCSEARAGTVPGGSRNVDLRGWGLNFGSPAANHFKKAPKRLVIFIY